MALASFSLTSLSIYTLKILLPAVLRKYLDVYFATSSRLPDPGIGEGNIQKHVYFTRAPVFLEEGHLHDLHPKQETLVTLPQWHSEGPLPFLRELGNKNKNNKNQAHFSCKRKDFPAYSIFFFSLV